MKASTRPRTPQSHWYGVSTTAEFKAAAQALTSTDLTSFWTRHRIEG